MNQDNPNSTDPSLSSTPVGGQSVPDFPTSNPPPFDSIPQASSPTSPNPDSSSLAGSVVSPASPVASAGLPQAGSIPEITPANDQISPPTPPSWDTVIQPPATPPAATPLVDTNPVPTFTPPDLSTPPVPQVPNFSSPEMGSSPDMPKDVEPAEAIPTDLSHLAGSPDSNGDGSPDTSAQPETLIVTPSSLPQEAQVVTTPGAGFPKWILIVGVLVLLVVIGGSAYFILGVGRSDQSSPAAPPVVEQPVAPTAIPTMPPEASSSAGGPGNFGNLNTSSPSGQISPTPGGTSAIELLKQRNAR